MKKVSVKVDSRNRISLTKVSKKIASSFYAHEEKDGRIILEPIVEVPAREAWLFKPENKEILEKIKRGLKQKTPGVSRGSFAHHVTKRSKSK
jgi:hypothetical protein